MMQRRDFLVSGLAGMAALGAGSHLHGADGKKVRIGVVAAGNRSRNHHVPLLRSARFPGVAVTALCDVTPQTLKLGLDACGPETTAYDDHRRMLAEQRDLDAVLVVVPNYLHAPVTLDALGAGKHVLVEKPMATRLTDADQMIEAARKNRRVLMVGQQSRYSAVYARVAELLREKAIGDLELVIASNLRSDWSPLTWIYTDPKTGKRAPWRHLTYTTGSSLLEDGIHQLDVIHWLVGAPPKRIQASGGNNVFKDRETIDHAALLIEFANDAKCSFVLTLFAPGLPNSRMMRLMGSQATLEVEQEAGGGSTIVIRRYRGSTERIPVGDAAAAEPRERAGGNARLDATMVRMYDAFLEAIASGAEPFASGKVGRDAIHISLAAERSLRTGRVIAWAEEEGL
jgi:predicted dehydrogenase